MIRSWEHGLITAKEADGSLCLGNEPGHPLHGPLPHPSADPAQIQFQPSQQWLPYVLSTNPGAKHVALGCFTHEECFRVYGLFHYSPYRD